MKVAEAFEGELVPELESYRRQFEAIKQDGEDLLRGLTEAQFNWRQEPGRWSIAQCLMHLNVTADLYLPIITGAISRARDKQLFGRGPFRHGRFGNWFVRSAEPPPKMKFKAPKKFIPPPDQPLDKVAPYFMNIQEKFLQSLRDANGIDLARVKLPSPATRLIKLSLGQAFALMAAHERRHLWQARQVRNDPKFPRV